MGLAVIKIGGSTIDAPGLLRELAEGAGALLSLDHLPLIVHGGGKDIARELDRLNKEFTFVEGMRVTDADSVKVVQMVLSGDVNKRIVNEMLLCGIPAVGMSGVDGGLFTAERMLVNGQDIGFVGDIVQVNYKYVGFALKVGYIPVISPVSRGADGAIYNVNADLAASELAKAMEAEDLIFISDVPGVKIGGSVRGVIKVSEIEGLIASGEVTGGMIPKLRGAAEAVEQGVGRVHICGWNGADTLANELTEGKSIGTVIQN
ncbi:MAG: acetylglutamate kinase [Chitinispirillia bacterium]|nr:acetylglutamate kinase [Chitinispirillia bacterium]MCL2242765.1 acetylglutamate kinase [Chitinispirillia bacterium]